MMIDDTGLTEEAWKKRMRSYGYDVDAVYRMVANPFDLMEEIIEVIHWESSLNKIYRFQDDISCILYYLEEKEDFLHRRVANTEKPKKRRKEGLSSLAKKLKAKAQEASSLEEIDEIQQVCIDVLSETFVRVSSLGGNIYMNSSHAIFAYMSKYLKNKKRERVYALLLDSKNALIDDPVLISLGSVNISIVHPREIFRIALENNAVSIILVHNHPSGDPTPSTQDRQISQRVFEVGKLIGIGVLDFIVMGSNTYISFLEQHLHPYSTY